MDMEPLWKTALWRQFGAAIDTLDNALVACPTSLWQERLWRDPPDHPQRPYGEFWYIAYHTLFWLDLYLSSLADPTQGITPPAPFPVAVFDAGGTPRERLFTKEELRAYLAYARQKCHTTIEALTEEQARYPFEFPWEKGKGRPISVLELLLYTMRHAQEHAAHLSLFLGQHGVPDEALDWVPQAQGEG